MPFCPQCQEEFREGFTTCSDCGTALVAELPQPPPAHEASDDEAWTQVAETSQIFEAELMATRIREAGIEAEVVDQTFHQAPSASSGVSSVRVLVPPDRADQARGLLEAQTPLPEDAEDAEDADGGVDPPEGGGSPEGDGPA